MESEATKAAAELAAQMGNVTGPAGQAVVQRARECAESHCSGHGRCMPLASDNCVCYPGFAGPKCARDAKEYL